ncbi:FAD-dependent oxidoreductase [Clostridium algoriphilum]|uniref:phytoene desaturase family protein n=1 Tax=Clostridium algoriphilum TaxID=198347 RepID=UPI001CF1F173|nr:FAD-dependent oxidoreductase [Clostridium algoriphilum]MCB2294368.1 FAD-dependent oxidoreductase [Clostridium algoriphilum]
MKEKVVIIGAGISGLSAGIYAQMNGFDSEIYEQHIIAGGECTSWKRKGYRIDGCLNWLTGTKQGTALHDVWKEVGAFTDDHVSYPEVFAATQIGDKTLFWYRDVEKLKLHFLELSPEDKLAIEEMYLIIKDLQSMNIPAKKTMDIMNIFEKIAFIKEMMPAFKNAGSIKKLSLDEYTERFKSPIIRAAIANFVPSGYIAMTFFTTAAMFAANKSGWLKGGSQALADNMLHKYEKLGGIFHGGNGVKRILVDNGNTSAIELNNGEKVNVDYVISACDTYVTMKKLLEDKYRDKKFDMMYSATKDYETCSIVHVAFGVDCDLSKYPAKVNYIHDV